MRFTPRAASVAIAAALFCVVFAVAPDITTADPAGPDPRLTGLELTHRKIEAVGVDVAGVPEKTRLKLTLNVPAMVRVRVKDTDPYGLSRAFNTDLPQGSSAITLSARVDGTKLPPGTYDVVVKAHNSSGSSARKYLVLRIVGKK
jgi:hypothetical protein